MINRKLILAVTSALALAGGSFAFADAQAAKDYVKQAQDLIGEHDTSGASAKLDLAEAELDSVDEASKSQIAASIAAVKKSIAGENMAGDIAKYHRKLSSAMDEAEGAVGNEVTWPGDAAAVQEIFDDPAAQAAIPDEIATAKKKFATFKKISDKKHAAAMTSQMDDAVKQLEDKWAEAKPKFSDANGDKNTAISDMTQALDDTKQQIAKLPPDSEAAKSYMARVDKVGAEFTQIALADKAKEVTARLKESFASYKDEYDGWQSETGPGPTWDEYQHQQNEKMSAFNAPKSKGLISRSDSFLKDLDNNDDYKQVSSAPEMKAFIDQVKADRDKAYAQMLANVNPLVASAIAAGGQDLSKLKDDVRLALGEESPEGKTLQESIQKKIDGATAAVAGADAANAEWYKKMSTAAAAAWPEISGKFSAEEGFDPNNPGAFDGKTIKITTDNLMGYRFKPGDFEFATTLNGMPIAAHFDPSLKAAIAAVEAKMGRSLGDNDDDGKWEIFAVVTGKKGQMLQKRQVEGDVKVDGEKVGTVTTEYADPVEAPIITIVAAKCGPFAGGKDAGIIQVDGTIAK